MTQSISNLPTRYTYIVKTNNLKTDNHPLNSNDYLNIGYMAGRYGVNLQNPNTPNPMVYNKDGIKFSINSCTADMFETNLKNNGIKYDRIA